MPYGLLLVLSDLLLWFWGIILLCYFLKKKPASKINPNSNEALFLALGGKDNLIESSLRGSRLKIKIKSNEKIDQQKLKDIGIDNTIVMSDSITLILNDKSKEEFKDFKLD